MLDAPDDLQLFSRQKAKPTCSSTLKASRMRSVSKASKDSAQSPPCSMNASPAAHCASRACRLRASPANTRGGMRAMSATAPSSCVCTCRICRLMCNWAHVALMGITNL
jgi:hypothetical protein